MRSLHLRVRLYFQIDLQLPSSSPAGCSSMPCQDMYIMRNQSNIKFWRYLFYLHQFIDHSLSINPARVQFSPPGILAIWGQSLRPIPAKIIEDTFSRLVVNIPPGSVDPPDSRLKVKNLSTQRPEITSTKKPTFWLLIRCSNTLVVCWSHHCCALMGGQAAGERVNLMADFIKKAGDYYWKSLSGLRS